MVHKIKEKDVEDFKKGFKFGKDSTLLEIEVADIFKSEAWSRGAREGYREDQRRREREFAKQEKYFRGVRRKALRK